MGLPWFAPKTAGSQAGPTTMTVSSPGAPRWHHISQSGSNTKVSTIGREHVSQGSQHIALPRVGTIQATQLVIAAAGHCPKNNRTGKTTQGFLTGTGDTMGRRRITAIIPLCEHDVTAIETIFDAFGKWFVVSC